VCNIVFLLIVSIPFLGFCRWCWLNFVGFLSGYCHWCSHFAVKWRKKLAYSCFQWRSFLYIPSSAYNIQCRVRYLASFYCLLWNQCLVNKMKSIITILFSPSKILIWQSKHSFFLFFSYNFIMCKYDGLQFLFHHLFSAIYFRFQVKKKQFFVNFMTITSFGAIGTLISCVVITFGTSYLCRFIY
jgi:hypothetical protein